MDGIEKVLFKERLIQKAEYQLSEVQGYLLDSCIARGDIQAARHFVQDWTPETLRSPAYVSKWQPGTHYYALDSKFATLDEAMRHIERSGYRYAGFKVVRI